jgi:hypothetical protein
MTLRIVGIHLQAYKLAKKGHDLITIKSANRLGNKRKRKLTCLLNGRVAVSEVRVTVEGTYG